MASLRISGWALASVLMMGWNSNGYTAFAPSGDSGPSVALQVVDGRPILDGVLVNGHGPYRFLVDTGSNVDLIENGLAMSIGLEPNYGNELSSAGGVSAVSGSAGNEVQITSLTADRQLFIFSDLQAIHHLSTDIRGVLGQPFLSRFDYLLDLRNKRIEFGKRDWQGIRVPFKMVNARPTMPTNLGWLVLDSGTKSVFLFGVKAAEVTQSVRTLSGSLETGTISTKLVIGESTVWRGDAIAVPRQAKEAGDGLLPVSIFKAIYICNSEGYIGFN